jgi:hypothetical protein
MRNTPIKPIGSHTFIRTGLTAALTVVLLCGAAALLRAAPLVPGPGPFSQFELYGCETNDTFVIWTADTNGIGAGFECGQRFSPSSALHSVSADKCFDQVSMLVGTSGAHAGPSGECTCGAPDGLAFLLVPPESFTYQMKLWLWDTDYATTIAGTPVADSGVQTWVATADPITLITNGMYQWVSLSLPTRLSANGQYFVQFLPISQTPSSDSGTYWGVWRNPLTDGANGGSGNEAYNGALLQTDREYIVRLDVVAPSGTLTNFYECGDWLAYSADNGNFSSSYLGQLFTPTNQLLYRPVTPGLYFNQTMLTVGQTGCQLTTGTPDHPINGGLSLTGVAADSFSYAAYIWQWKGSYFNSVWKTYGTLIPAIAGVTNTFYSRYQDADLGTGPAMCQTIVLNHPPLPVDGSYIVTFHPLSQSPMGSSSGTHYNIWWGLWYWTSNPNPNIENIPDSQAPTWNGALNGFPSPSSPNGTPHSNRHYDVRLNLIPAPTPQITSVTRASGNITITWTNGVLQWTTDLNPPATWTSTGNYLGGSLTEAMSATQKFYRAASY